jgi:hypothetical protein
LFYALEFGGDPTSPNAGVFVEPFPATGQRYQAPRLYRDFAPVWGRDGKSILYLPESPGLVSVPIATGPVVTFGKPVELQYAPRPGLQSFEPRGYDVLPDGRVLSVSAVFDDGPSAASAGGVRVVLNWLEELKRLVPVK